MCLWYLHLFATEGKSGGDWESGGTCSDSILQPEIVKKNNCSNDMINVLIFAIMEILALALNMWTRNLKVILETSKPWTV